MLLPCLNETQLVDCVASASQAVLPVSTYTITDQAKSWQRSRTMLVQSHAPNRVPEGLGLCAGWTDPWAPGPQSRRYSQVIHGVEERTLALSDWPLVGAVRMKRLRLVHGYQWLNEGGQVV